MRISLAILLLSLIFGINSSAQSITGSLSDNNGEPVIYANVVLSTTADSSIVKIETTDEIGQFKFSEISNGEYYLEASYVGMADYLSNEITLGSEDINLGTLTMRNSGIELETAVVTARRALVEVKADRVVFNVEGTVNSAGDNGLGLLRKAPGVLVDNNNNISVLGRSGVQVYVDGKRLPISGDELKAYLESLPAEQIDKIDIISNPGARYEAEGNAGIIDIRLKKNKAHGFNGSLSATASKGKIARGNNSLNLNYRNKSFNAYGNLGYGWGKWYEDITFDSAQNGFRLLGRAVWEGVQQGENVRLGTDFFVSENHTVGFVFSAGTTAGDYFASNSDIISDNTTLFFGDDTPADIVFPVSEIDSILIGKRDGYANRKRKTYNLNYTFSKEDLLVNIDADYGRFTNEQSFMQPNTYFNNLQDQVLNYREYFFDTPIAIDISTFKADFENNLFGGKIGTGVKLSVVSTDNTFEFYDVDNQQRTFNDFKSNNFNYDETVYATYVNYSQVINEKLNVSAGLRAEQTNTNSELFAFVEDLKEDPRDSSYLSFFPSVGLSYASGPKSSWSFNYGRRINRPDYNVLNPFRGQSSELNFNIGNPALKPEIVNNLEIGYTYNYRYNFKLSYSRTTDQITRLIGTDSSDPKASFINWDNLAEQKIYNFNASLPFQVTSYWTAFINLSANWKDNQATYPDGNMIDLQAFGYNVYQQHAFTLPKGFVFEVGGWYNGPGIWGGVFLYESQYSLDMGIQKKFFSDKLSIKVSYQDITNQAWWNGFSNFDGLLSYGQGNFDNSRGSISLSYNFGSNTVKKSRERKTGIEDESNRVGG